MAVSTGVIGGSLKATGVTPLDVATQGRCSTALHGLDDFEMRNRQPMVAAIRLAVDAKDIGQFNAASCCCRPLTGGPHGLGSTTGACREDSRQHPRFVAVASSSAGWKEARCGPSKTGSSAGRRRPPEDGWRSRHEDCEYHGPF